MNKLKALAILLTKPNRLKALLSFEQKGYLASIGWFNAFDKHQAVDKDGNPIPWVTYSFIDFITPRISKDLSVFEYGSGSSTFFYAKKAKKVVSVEHDELWLNKVIQNKPENAEMIFSKLETNGEYAKKAVTLGEKFDLIIVDGRDRVNCCKHSIHALSDTGVIVLDDSEREGYEEARVFLTQEGFKELYFSGISPGLFYLKATSVFYKTANCLHI